MELETRFDVSRTSVYVGNCCITLARMYSVKKLGSPPCPTLVIEYGTSLLHYFTYACILVQIALKPDRLCHDPKSQSYQKIHKIHTQLFE